MSSQIHLRNFFRQPSQKSDKKLSASSLPWGHADFLCAVRRAETPGDDDEGDDEHDDADDDYGGHDDNHDE